MLFPSKVRQLKLAKRERERCVAADQDPVSSIAVRMEIRDLMNGMGWMDCSRLTWLYAGSLGLPFPTSSPFRQQIPRSLPRHH